MTPIIAALWLAAACVPQKKFDALQAELTASQAAAAADAASREAKATELRGALEAETKTVQELGAKITEVQGTLTTREAEVDLLTAEKARLVTDKTKLKSTVEETTMALKELQARKAQAEARVAQYRDLLSRFKALIDAGRLKVKIVDGRMVVELATDVLFDSGKADLSKAGHTAIAEVGAVLAAIPDRKFQVEGHTDNDPIKTAQFPSNWELASARAITVVRSLVEAGLPPDRVSAASYGEFRPVVANASSEGKSTNRRIEITVVADLSQLPGFEELQQLGQDRAAPQ